MNLTFFHDMTFWALYAALAIAAFVVVERFIFFTQTQRKARLLEAAVGPGKLPSAELLAQNSVPSTVARTMIERLPLERTRHDVEDLSEELFIAARTALNRNLWILDTIVTASPLLGLLGTILGIIDTFTVLARSGISDPSGVSAGIGTALIATALGISVALFGLLFFNHFQARVEQLGDQIKVLILRLSQTRQPEAN